MFAETSRLFPAGLAVHRNKNHSSPLSTPEKKPALWRSGASIPNGIASENSTPVSSAYSIAAPIIPPKAGPLQSIPDAYYLLRQEDIDKHPQPEFSWAESLWLKTMLNSMWLPGNLIADRSGWFGKLQLDRERTDVGLFPVNEDMGLLYRPDGGIVGTVNRHAELRFNDRPGVWDLFNNPFLQLNYQRLKDYEALGESLISLAFEHATQNNIAPYIRGLYPNLTGKGTNIAVIDFDTNHIKNIQSIISSPQYGVAPGADVQFHLFSKTPSAFQNQTGEEIPSTKTQLDRMILSDFLSDFYLIQDKLTKLIEAEKPPTVVVISLTMERLLEYSSLVYESLPQIMPYLERSQEKGIELDPALRKVVDAFTKQDLLESFQAVIDYVDSVLDTSPDLREAIFRYQDLTKQLHDRGSMLVVSAGNSQSHFARGLRMRSDAILNFLGNSDYVILVGGSDPRQTPTNYLDDKMAAFSNIGSDPFSHRGAPTLIAPALLLPIDTSFIGQANEKAFNNGTSLAAPWVAGIICLLRQAAPGLSNGELEQILLQACDNAESLPQDFVGAGFLNPFKAIQTASLMQQQKDLAALYQKKLAHAPAVAVPNSDINRPSDVAPSSSPATAIASPDLRKMYPTMAAAPVLSSTSPFSKGKRSGLPVYA